MNDEQTLHNIVLTNLLECKLLLWQGQLKDVVSLTEKTYKESLDLWELVLSLKLKFSLSKLMNVGEFHSENY